jgi:hypothetical protein
VRLDGRSLGALGTKVLVLRAGTQHQLVATDVSGNSARLTVRVPKRA